MAKGTIKDVNPAGHGFIAPDGSDPNDRKARVFFRVEWLPAGAAKPGTRVEFDIQDHEKGPRAGNLRLEGGGNRPAASTHEPAYTGRAGNQPATQGEPRRSNAAADTKFLNPYNFVRPMAKPRPAKAVLGDCPPPPHDRYIGLTGRITCELEAVTPLFVSDSHAVERPDKHATYRFFRLDDKPALPATSLRGMVRSVYEAVTNSCYAIFQRDDETKDGTGDRLEYRVTRDPGLRPARVIAIDANGATVEILDCTVNKPFPVASHPTLVRSGCVPVYSPRVVKQLGEEVQGFHPVGVIARGLAGGARVAAIVSTEPKVHRTDRYQWLRVEQVVAAADHATLHAGANQRKVFGYLHFTGPNIENKHDERLFFRWGDDDPAPRRTYNPDDVPVSTESVREYNRMLEHYWERHGEAVQDLSTKHWPVDGESLPHPSRFVREGRRLAVGDLVYIFYDKARQRDRLCPVSMPRLAYHNPREALLPKHLWLCTDWNKLCPACRMFGWVHAEAEKLDTDVRTAYAGRVRISHGTLQESKGTLAATPLAILSSPKPTTTAFYLLNSSGAGGNIDYDTPGAKLRGRKVYRHHGSYQDWPAEQRAEFVGKQESDQNRTVRDALAPGARFTFDVDFECLSPLELGALLWALELEPGMHHRLGFAKPLGFGSVCVRVASMALLEPCQRYTSLDLAAGWEKQERETGKQWPWVEQFQHALAQVYGGEFATLAPVCDLRVLLSAPTPSSVHRIHYPRATAAPTVEGENFRWFVGNKRNLGHNDHGQWLRLPEEERGKEGALRLVDAGGKDI